MKSHVLIAGLFLMSSLASAQTPPTPPDAEKSRMC